MKNAPTSFQWADGKEASETGNKVFYNSVLQDNFICPLFSNMWTAHANHVAHFIAEGLGSNGLYTQINDRGHPQMAQRHTGKFLTREQRRRLLQPLLQTADERDLASDPEFRPPPLANPHWGNHLAILCFNLTENPEVNQASMSKWEWVVAVGPNKFER